MCLIHHLLLLHIEKRILLLHLLLSIIKHELLLLRMGLIAIVARWGHSILSHLVIAKRLLLLLLLLLTKHILSMHLVVLNLLVITHTTHVVAILLYLMVRHVRLLLVSIKIS